MLTPRGGKSLGSLSCYGILPGVCRGCQRGRGGPTTGPATLERLRLREPGPCPAGGAEVAPSQTGEGQGVTASRALFLRQDLNSGTSPDLRAPTRPFPARREPGAPRDVPAPLHSQEGLDGAVRLQGLGQLLDAVDVGDDAQVEVELGQGAGLSHPPTHMPEVPLGELAAPQ